MRFFLLGPLRVTRDGADLPVRGTLRRTLLAALLLHRDTVVSTDRLSELLWPGDAEGRLTPLYNQITRLRQSLADDGTLIRAVPPGYLVHVSPEDLDLTEFTALCAQAREAATRADWLSAAKLYTAALTLWRGHVLICRAGLSRGRAGWRSDGLSVRGAFMWGRSALVGGARVGSRRVVQTDMRGLVTA